MYWDLVDWNFTFGAAIILLCVTGIYALVSRGRKEE